MKLQSFSTSNNPIRTVIALHGWTGDINSMLPVAKMLKLKNTKWIIPEAPYKSEKKGYSWYYQDRKKSWRFKKSLNIVSKIIQQTLSEGFLKKNIFILGFSQGASLSLEFLIRQNFSLGGVIPIAGFFKSKNKFKKDFNTGSKETPILLIHGANDKIVLPSESEKSKIILEYNNYSASLKLFFSGHKIPFEARKVIQDFICI
jgi:phospholipase/carboxylesterase